MKLSKSLLSAILIGIAVQTTVTSCSKDKDVKDPKAKKEAKDEKNTPTAPCPACGMG